MAERVLFVGPLERVLYLRTVPALQGLHAPELAAIAQHARERFFPRGTRLLQPRQPTESVFLIVDGRVSVSRDGVDEPDAGPGETVGLLHLLARAPEGIEARAVEDTQTLELDWDALLDVSEEYFSVTLAYLRYLSRRLLEHPPAEPEAPDTGSIVPTTNALHLVDRTLALARCSLFSAANADSLVELSRHLSLVHYRSGQRVWSAGDPTDGFLVIVAGAVRAGPADAHVRFGSTHTAGLYEALTEQNRLHDAVAETDVTALQVETEGFLDILEDHFEMAVDVTATLAGRLLSRGAADRTP